MGSTREFYKKLLARHLNGDVAKEEVSEDYGASLIIISQAFVFVKFRNLIFDKFRKLIFDRLRKTVKRRAARKTSLQLWSR